MKYGYLLELPDGGDSIVHPKIMFSLNITFIFRLNVTHFVKLISRYLLYVVFILPHRN